MKCSARFLLLSLVVLSTTNLLSQQQPRQASYGWQRLNAAITAAETGNEQAIRSLVRTAYQVEGLPAEAIAVADPITDRLVQAELNYRAGKKQGIDERNIVSTVNGLARKLGAPSYAFTSPWEVRKLRSRLLVINPGLITRESLHPGRNDHSGGISKHLSPVEAFHVAAMMIRQKMVNPEYQLTYREQVAKWHLLNSPNPAARLGNGGRRQEMAKTITLAFSSMSFRDLILQGEDSLKTLGIE